jgi:hypothetical protein
MKQYFLFLVLMILSSRYYQEEPEYQLPNPQPKVVKTNGYVVPKDSMVAPMVIKIDKRQLKVVKAGKPKVVDTNTNIHKAGQPNI